MSEAWVTFVQKGQPISDSLPEWPEYNEETSQTIFLDSNCKIVSDPGSEMRKIWTDKKN